MFNRLFALMTVALAATAVAAGLPPAMTDLGFDEAVAANAEHDKRLLIVKFTAEWCGPCKMMDRTTWSDEGVIRYLNDHNITVIAVDVDEEPGVSQANSVRAMPTMVAFQSGKEMDRNVGFMDDQALTAWLDDLRAGRTQADARAEQIQNRDELDMQSRLILAGEIAQDNPDLATEEYVWLWNNIAKRDMAMTGVRVSFMASDMEHLAQRHEPAREAFTNLRDELTQRLKSGQTSRENLSDWLVLNIRVLGDDQAVESWIERIKDRPAASETFQAMGHIVENWLIEQGRWAMYGQVLAPASQRIATARTLRRMQDDSMFEDDEMAEEIRTVMRRHEIDEFARIHAAYLAANRDDEAWQAADALLEDFPGEEAIAAVCRFALRADVVSPRHRELAEKLVEQEHAPLRSAINESADGDA